MWVQGTMKGLLDVIKIGQIHLQPREVTSWRCGLLPNYFRYVIIITIIQHIGISVFSVLMLVFYIG